MKKEEAYVLGRVLKPDGYSGQILISITSDTPDHYAHLKNLWLGGEEPEYECIIEKIELHGNSTAAVSLTGIDTHEKALALVRKQVWVPLSFLPKLEGSAFYFHEITGFVVEDASRGAIGLAKGILELPQQKLLEIDRDGKEILLPISPMFYKGIDRGKRIIYVSIPDGLLEL